MANPNLVKSPYAKKKDNTRVIDNNARIEERIAAYQEEQRRKQMAAAQRAPEPVYADEFEEGLNAEQLEQLTSDQTVYASPEGGEGAFEEGYSEDEIPPDAGMIPQEEFVPPPPAPMPAPPAVDVQAMIEEAQEQANQILASAQQEADAIREQAQRQGYDAGYNEGFEGAKAAAMQELEQENEMRREQLEMEYQKRLDEIEPTMVDTLTRIYEHVFDVNLRKEKSVILHLLQTTLSRVEPNGDFFVHISPSDYDYVSEEKEMLRSCINNPNATLELIEDPLLAENECMIETDGGIFDCSLGVELTELTRKMKLLAFDRRRN